VTADLPPPAETEVQAQGQEPVSNAVVAPHTTIAEAPLAHTACPVQAKTLEVPRVREDQDQEVAHPQEAPPDAAPPMPKMAHLKLLSPELPKEILRHRIVRQTVPVVKHQHKTMVRLQQTASRPQPSNLPQLTAQQARVALSERKTELTYRMSRLTNLINKMIEVSCVRRHTCV